MASTSLIYFVYFAGNVIIAVTMDGASVLLKLYFPG